jgi:hypothetical protein
MEDAQPWPYGLASTKLKKDLVRNGSKEDWLYHLLTDEGLNTLQAGVSALNALGAISFYLGDSQVRETAPMKHLK